MVKNSIFKILYKEFLIFYIVKVGMKNGKNFQKYKHWLSPINLGRLLEIPYSICIILSHFVI